MGLLVAALVAPLASQSPRKPARFRNSCSWLGGSLTTEQRAGGVGLLWVAVVHGRANHAASPLLPVAQVHRIRSLEEPRHDAESEPAASEHFLYCGVDAAGRGVVGWLTAHQAPAPRLQLADAAVLPDAEPFDVAYCPHDRRLWVLDGRHDAMLTAPWAPGDGWPEQWRTVLTAADDDALGVVDSLEPLENTAGVRLWHTYRPSANLPARVERFALRAVGERWILEAELDDAAPDWLVHSQDWEFGAPRLLVTAQRATDGFEIVDVGSGEVLLSDSARRGQTVSLPLPDVATRFPGRTVRVRGESIGRSPAFALVPRYGKPWRSADDWVARLAPLDIEADACTVGGELRVASTLTRTKPAGHGDQLQGYLLLALASEDPTAGDVLVLDEGRAVLAPTLAVPFHQDHSHPRPDVGVAARADLPDDAALAGQTLLVQLAILGPAGEVVLSDVLATTIWPEGGAPERLPRDDEATARAQRLPAAAAALRRFAERSGHAGSTLDAVLARVRATLRRR
jgi:hypothetical protein